jgi:oligopeptide transport system ATP-binding protein
MTKPSGRLLEVRDLGVQFGHGPNAVIAVNGVSFHVDRGETLGIVGESGCGKSATALTIMRLLPEPPARVRSGSVCFDGRDLLKLDRGAMSEIRGNEIAMIFQDPMTSLNPALTVGRQLRETVMRHLDVSRAAAQARAIDLLGMVGIPRPRDRIDDYPHHFSGGMRQRVMIAMALSCEPRLLIADEPTTSLDVTIQAQILELIARLTDEREMATMLITHDMGVVAGMADRIQVMYAGHVVERGMSRTIFRNPRHPYTKGLLGSIPRVDAERPSRLPTIAGLPPNLDRSMPGCPFVPRCSFRIPTCSSEGPALQPVDQSAAQHEISCWVDVTGAGVGGRAIHTSKDADA